MKEEEEEEEEEKEVMTQVALNETTEMTVRVRGERREGEGKNRVLYERLVTVMCRRI